MKLLKRQKRMIDTYTETTGKFPLFFDEFPASVRADLRAVKDSETLHTDVQRYVDDQSAAQASAWHAGANFPKIDWQGVTK
jgi:hypothetical protein